MSTQIYYYQFCEKGHPIVDHLPITKRECYVCGKPLLTHCPECGTKLPNRFASPSQYGSNEPLNRPERPSQCEHCGKSFHWGFGMGTILRGLFATGEAGLKGTSPTRLLVLVLVLLVTFGLFFGHWLVKSFRVLFQ